MENSQSIELRREGGDAFQATLTIADSALRNEVYKRLQRIVEDKRTHGIEIQSHKISHTSLPGGTLELRKLPPGNTLDLGIWDFGGQLEYYNNHHHFISTRSVFLVLWNVNEGEKGLHGLEFWLKSLKAHLPPKLTGEYSILVVITHIDGLVEDHRQSFEFRKAKLRNVFEKKCLLIVPFDYHEISNKNGDNVASLSLAIAERALNHSYMGELVPQDYLRAEALITP